MLEKQPRKWRNHPPKLDSVKLGTKTLKTEDYSFLLRLAFKLLKYLFLVLFGFAIACILSESFGPFPVVEMLWSSLRQWFWRLAVFVFCFIATAVLVESLR